MATRPIEPGAEVYADYGALYWRLARLRTLTAWSVADRRPLHRTLPPEQ